MSKPPHNMTTRNLNVERSEESPVQPTRGTGPLQFALPWVVELRVVGTVDVLRLKLKERMVIGRSDESGHIVPDIDLNGMDAYKLGVSRQHAILAALNSRVTLCDLHSSNGTYVNGGRLEPGKEYRVTHGDQIAFGNLAFQVNFVMTPSSHEKKSTGYTDILIPKMGEGQRILLVDDDENYVQTISDVLSQAGFRVDTAATMTEATTYFDHHIPSAVVMELILPDQNGIDLVHYIRKRVETRNIPVIVASGATGGYQMGQAKEAGANIILTKPVGIDELIESFSQILVQMR